MSPRLRSGGGLAIALLGQLFFAACTEQQMYDLLYSDGVAIANPPEIADYAPGGQQYGVKGSLSTRQLAALKGLAWPQSYEDVKGTFGFPSHRTETADYYALQGDDSIWVVIHYSGKTATRYTTEER
ncbi:hypothetical protein [Pseudanabaena sp. FACHB-2040]|uniref:hypothetical protein n=1 Tax=Pseudanabaena sp. FACHB-2040 TaxID=2692859 RepID=UPI0016896BEF|nr:hypothetical protein [Pseudanabaena sp. FACHB-2040]MBD2259904.1 hypothetical protein [Pseudanabaena sp. FACHB-2040]